MSDPGLEAGIKRVREAVISLGEHWDTVHIFVTRHESGTDDGGTSHCNLGAGNLYAREGQVREWLTKHDEQTRESERERS